MEWSWVVGSNDTWCNLRNVTGLEASCYGQGTCQLDPRTRAMICLCNGYYDQRTYCERNFFQVYNGADLFFPFIGIIILIPCLLGYLLEIAVDLRRRGIRRSALTASWLTKVVMVFLCISRIIWFSIWAHRSITKTVDLVVLEGITGLLGTIFAMTACIVAIAWLDLIQQVKALGDKSNIHKVRKFLIIFMAVLFPITFIIGILSRAVGNFPNKNILFLVVNACIGLVLLVFASVSTYEFIVLRSWLLEHAKLADISKEREREHVDSDGHHVNPRDHTNASINLIYRTRILVALTALIWLGLIAASLQLALGNELPSRFFVLQVISRYIETSLAPLMFFFVENYAFKYGFMRYITAWTEAAEGSTTETNGTNKVDVNVTFSSTMNQTSIHDTVSKASEHANDNSSESSDNQSENTATSS